MLPDIMRYRQMKTAYRQKTYVRNSPIHSLGLFAKAEYAAQEMVIVSLEQPPLKPRHPRRLTVPRAGHRSTPVRCCRTKTVPPLPLVLSLRLCCPRGDHQAETGRQAGAPVPAAGYRLLPFCSRRRAHHRLVDERQLCALHQPLLRRALLSPPAKRLQACHSVSDRPGAAAAELHRPRHEPRWLAADHIQHRP